ncbi:uncharacterized protein yc1106_03285 [Curvularia clavata]|uniref:DNA mismatch repair protein S5 domain-containing protein n=1 Tax=Curvularia clavata TaxID=95742 RepID=A0A9Q9DS35_CURCL|nr:uncharacterized protein yc1106_03285 [Curvularia clavata]
MTDSMDTSESSPRGTKRKGDDSLSLPAPRRIKALSQDVVNKIAAGEIIVAPQHALKELIENAVDAGSTALEILVKDGGLKLLQITDNGHGIDKEDLPILCERFTTSKLKAFEDLTSIGTYGFRGEALASISHIAHLKVTTRTKESSCAWEAHYADGKLVSPKPGQSAEPKPKAGRQGTTITVEDLFYNVPSRRRAFRSPSEEYAKILDIVGRYAVHCQGVAFSCKRVNESSGNSLTVPVSATVQDRIRQIHGSGAANELVALNIEDDRWGFKCDGWISNANYSVRKTQMMLFINHRSVESSVIKKSVEQTYATFLPKGGHPFFYISLEIEPQRVDVNVHPTKREVHFLNEDEIIAMICDSIRDTLSKVDTSRIFPTHSLMSNPKVPLATPVKQILPVTPSKGEASNRSASHAPQTATRKRNETSLVRTDESARKITTMLQPQQSHEEISEEEDEEMEDEPTEKVPIATRLTSVKELRAEVHSAMHNELTDIISTHTFVGIVDEEKRIAAIQGGIKLFLIDYGMLSNELFYQIGVHDFANYGYIRFEPPLSLHELLTVAVEQEKANAGNSADEVDWEEVVDVVREQLITKAALLSEYFAIDITPEGELCSIPLLLKDYTPSMGKLPQFLLRLGPHVNWDEEKSCFRTILREIASFYVPESLPFAPAPEAGDGENGDGEVQSGLDEDPEAAERRQELLHAIEYTIFPACKARLVGTKGMLKNGVTEVANLKGLYRVFERC